MEALRECFDSLFQKEEFAKAIYSWKTRADAIQYLSNIPESINNTTRASLHIAYSMARWPDEETPGGMGSGGTPQS